MDKNGRYTHIEDVLVHLHTGQWFGWSDSSNKVYANLILHEKIWDQTYTGNKHDEGFIDNPYTKPTEKSLTDALAKQQADFDANQYQRDRQYPQLGEQLDMLFHDMTAGKGDKTGEWYKAVAKVKADNPKPTE